MIRTFTIGCCLILIVIMPILCSKRNVEPWIEHNARVDRFACRSPQPRSFDLSEILPKNSTLRTIAGTIYPQKTVLYRCEHAGCCKGVKRCLPNSIDEVKLVFAVISPVMKPNTQYQQVTVLNHTQCSCQNRKDKPK
ncbi:uncharacterized protein LOC123317589 [Coccinella septempunctata]|uniref:uncharacterized protein LOC123317589 n=1 Tax=Coccinella septempunctata TaxID=41139 RepID=UPI001D05DBC9|nr:uncharacterized protein LOC123317589 [Coccinella septempunctata]XP_044760128.1 uncharacterized protein LOC123317589 [Coccinella septempunctata]XP_044760135.1 uncharacterized protein LOC123317589 [Coccinella septempunctata]